MRKKSSTRKKRILVIDDDPSILDALSLILEDVGYDVLPIEKGDEAFGEAVAFKPDVILLDVLMSGVDGREICKRLKKDPRTQQIPVIMISAHPGVSQKIKEFGANDFLAKPFETDDLLEMIEKYI